MDIVHENGGVLGSGDYDGGFLDLYDLCSGFIVSLMLTVIIRESGKLLLWSCFRLHIS